MGRIQVSCGRFPTEAGELEKHYSPAGRDYLIDREIGTQKAP